jgi:pterin-4a-carbinolamine dehydratase
VTTTAFPAGWRHRGGALVRELAFRDFDEGMRFLGRLAENAVDYGRRPDMSIASNHVVVSIENPHHAGLTLAELRLLGKVEAVIEGWA